MATFLEQSIAYQQTQIATLKAQQEQYDNLANSLSPQYSAARRALRDAQANPATPPAELARLQAEFDSISNQYFTARDNASSNQSLLTRTEEALASNLQKVNDPAQNVSFSTPAGTVNTGGTTTATSTGQDPTETQQTQAQQNATSLPSGQTGQGTLAPGAGVDPAQQAFLDANADPASYSDESPVIDDQEADLLETQRAEAAAIAEGEQQKQIAINTQGLPVLAEDGSVVNDVAINPETGETYYTTNTDGQSQNTGTDLARSSGNTEAGGGAEVQQSTDFRFKIQLAPVAPGATYLYNDPDALNDPNHILHPLTQTSGVVFPYTPQINITYAANYEPTDLTHTNYRIYNYRNSAVDQISVTGMFTAQDTFEANYLLAVIHFFRSVTKMFYGKDENPRAGIPPPLCYLNGYGTYGFVNHQVVVSSFSLNYPDDVDYINASPKNVNGSNLNFSPYKSPTSYNSNVMSRIKQGSNGLQPGGTAPGPKFNQGASSQINTRVPTKLQIQLTCLPVITRYNMANNFSLKDYASGKLLQKGIW